MYDDPPVSIRVAEGVSSLTSLVLKVAIGRATDDDKSRLLSSFGDDTVRDAINTMPKYFRSGDGVLVRDCDSQERGAVEFTVCHHDRPCEESSVNRNGTGNYKFAFPCFPHGYWPPNRYKWVIPEIDRNEITIGFCGLARPDIRAEALDVVSDWCGRDDSVSCEIVTRRMFMGREVDTCRSDFISNMSGSLYQIAARGVGNFSYRLYETMSFGRIPIIVGDHALPLPSSLFDPVVVFASTPNDIPDAVVDFHSRRNGPDRSRLIRQTWMWSLSPVGWWRSTGCEVITRQLGEDKC